MSPPGSQESLTGALDARAYGILKAIARKLVHHQDSFTGTELAHEVWLRVHSSKRPNTPTEWRQFIALTEIACRRLRIDRHRRRESRAARLAGLTEIASSDIEGLTSDLLDCMDLRTAITNLEQHHPEDIRVVLAHKLDGETLKAIAQKEQLPYTTVRARYIRGLELLRRELAN